jgi:hypothetical protein
MTMLLHYVCTESMNKIIIIIIIIIITLEMHNLTTNSNVTIFDIA